MNPAAHADSVAPAALRITRTATAAALPAFFALADAACQQAGASEADAYAVRLAVEEVAVNLIEHGYRGQPPGPITLAFDLQPRRIVICIADRSPPFAPDSAPAPDLDSDWDARLPGGVGLHLVRQFVDTMHYETDASGENRLTLVRQLGG